MMVTIQKEKKMTLCYSYMKKTKKLKKQQLMSKCADTARMPFRKWSSTVFDKWLPHVPHFSSVAKGEGKPFPGLINFMVYTPTW